MRTIPPTALRNLPPECTPAHLELIVTSLAEAHGLSPEVVRARLSRIYLLGTRGYELARYVRVRGDGRIRATDIWLSAKGAAYRMARARREAPPDNSMIESVASAMARAYQAEGQPLVNW